MRIDRSQGRGVSAFYLTARIGVEPEVLYMVGPGSDRDVTLIPQLTFDFVREKVRPYIIGELVYAFAENGSIRFSNNEWVE